VKSQRAGERVIKTSPFFIGFVAIWRYSIPELQWTSHLTNNAIGIECPIPIAPPAWMNGAVFLFAPLSCMGSQAHPGSFCFSGAVIRNW